MSSKEIRDLVKASQNGSAEAFGELYEKYSDEMFRYACYYLGDRFRAEDAASDAVCSAFSSVHTLKNADAFKSWIFKILIRSCQKQLKYIIGQRREQDFDTLNEASHDGDFAETTALKQALSILSQEDRSIVLLSAVSKYTSREIGEMLGISPSTVRSRLKRATDKLYAFLSEERSDEK